MAMGKENVRVLISQEALERRIAELELVAERSTGRRNRIGTVLVRRAGEADGSVRIEQVIFVERENQRKIVLGKGGQTIKEIGQRARTELSRMLEQKVHLFLFVKVRANWATDPERLRAMGLEP